MSKNAFDIVFLVARPAAGKSEIIDYLKKTPVEKRIERFHIQNFEEIDDFPMLWTWFEEDALLEKKFNKPRIHTDAEGYFKYPYLWHLLIERISLEYQKKLRDADYHNHFTNIVEFARGTEHGGFKEAFNYVNPEMLKRGAILYIKVSWEQSLMKNKRRFNPKRPDSILEHGLPDEKMEKLYRENDWEEFKGNRPDYIRIKDLEVPYAVFENEDDVTTGRGEPLGARLEETLQLLWQRYTQNK